jgi:1-acyl-sn-glycerol-3-phosphate acyltransferase
MLGVRVTVTGGEHVATGGPFVYTPNHQSHLDILALLGHLPGATRFVAKQSLWRHKVVGAVLDSLGMVPIDRESSAEAVAALNRVRDEGQSFVVFPEGTRSRDGRLNEFKKGAFVLAIRLGLPVVPVVCRGTRRLMPRGSRLNVIPGDVELVIERPIPTDGLRFDDRDALSAQVREAILRHHTGW